MGEGGEKVIRELRLVCKSQYNIPGNDQKPYLATHLIFPDNKPSTSPRFSFYNHDTFQLDHCSGDRIIRASNDGKCDF
jgi:hypothetical protein